MNNYTTEQFRKLKEKTKQIVLGNNSWNNVGLARKVVNGKVTDDISITLYVENKLDINQLNPDDIFPSYFLVDSINNEVPSDVCVADVDFIANATNACYTEPAYNTNPSTWLMPISGNRTVRRPLVGGTSIGTIPSNNFGGGYIGVGTLGGLAVDLDDYTIVGVTNNHVLNLTLNSGGVTDNIYGGDVYYFSQNTPISTTYSFYSYLCASLTYSSLTAPNSYAYPVYQPGSMDLYSSVGYSQSSMEPFKIGYMKRSYPMSTNNNLIDCSIFKLDTTKSGLSSTSENWQQFLLDISTPMDWATESEIDSLLTTNFEAPIFRTGRTLGPVGYPGALSGYGTTCALSARSLGYNLNINYGGKPQYLGCTDTIYVIGTADASSGGDSGSFVCALLDAGNPALSAWKVVGQLFASSSSTGNMLANRIDHVASLMNLSAYKGDALEIESSRSTVVIEGHEISDPFIYVNGKKYWQAGVTSAPANATPDS